MDAQLNGLANTLPNLPSLDVYVAPAATGKHIVPILTGTAEEEQQAQVLCQLTLNMIPQLPGIGNDWIGFLTGSIAFLQLDMEIRQTLANGGHEDYYPDYSIVNDALTVQAMKQAALG
jgi:hypothetical protein